MLYSEIGEDAVILKAQLHDWWYAEKKVTSRFIGT